MTRIEHALHLIDLTPASTDHGEASQDSELISSGLTDDMWQESNVDEDVHDEHFQLPQEVNLPRRSVSESDLLVEADDTATEDHGSQEEPLLQLEQLLETDVESDAELDDADVAENDLVAEVDSEQESLLEENIPRGDPIQNDLLEDDLLEDLTLEESQTAGTLCEDCDTVHHSRRLVICIDGTWMKPDGQIGNYNGNTSNIYRIWQLVPRKKQVQDASGKTWLQICAPFEDGVGAEDRIISRLVTGVTGRGRTGCDEKIKKVYKACCKLCASKDEIFLFGFSRGAFIARAVAGLLYHLKALAPDTENFDEVFQEGLNIYRAARTRDELRKHAVHWFRKQHTVRPAKIRFLGCFDTVKAFDDSGLNDIGLLSNVCHTRHALALFEGRTAFEPSRFDPALICAQANLDRSYQEAWFAGNHGNMGGACPEDGLALWPLQWILSEAQKQGLSLEFDDEGTSNATDPRTLVFLQDDDYKWEIECANGISLTMYDISDIFKQPRFRPSLVSGKSIPFSTQKDRNIFAQEKLIGRLDSAQGTFVHPSVFLMDHKYPAMVRTINELTYAELLRNEEDFIVKRCRRMWDLERAVRVKREVTRPRLLICGQTSAGKSSLINKIFGQDVAKVSHGSTPSKHKIKRAIEVHDHPFRIHDSQGFEMEASVAKNFQKVQDFIAERRKQPVFNEQLHCILYCWPGKYGNRIQEADLEFMNLDFGGIPVILVLTKLDELRSLVKDEVFQKHVEASNQHRHAEDLADLPEEDRNMIREVQRQALEMAKRDLFAEWDEHQDITIELQKIFVSKRPADENTIQSLMAICEQAMRGDSIARIHMAAQDEDCRLKREASIAATAKIFMASKPTVDIRKEKYISHLERQIVSECSNIYRFTDCDVDFATKYLAEVCRKSIGETFSPGKLFLENYPGLYAAVAPISIAAEGGTLAAGLAAGTSVAGVAVVAGVRARITAMLMFTTCLDFLLVMDRLYWYEGSSIGRQTLQVASIYHLKQQVAVHEWASKNFISVLLDPNYSETKVRRALRAGMNKFRYIRPSSVPVEE